MKILGFVSSNLEGRVFTVGSVRRLAYGKPLNCSTGKYATKERPSIGVRQPSIDVPISQWVDYCPASRTTLVATRFRVAVICPIIQVPHCIRVFFYFV